MISIITRISVRIAWSIVVELVIMHTMWLYRMGSRCKRRGHPWGNVVRGTSVRNGLRGRSCKSRWSAETKDLHFLKIIGVFARNGKNNFHNVAPPRRYEKANHHNNGTN